MNWTITVKPSSSALNMWSWSAVRDDQESVLSGGGYESSEEAMSAAQVDTVAFEQTQGIIRDATFTVQFDPITEEVRPVEPTPEEPPV